MVKLSRKEAIEYFETIVLPRRVRNWGEERKQFEKFDRRKVCYRRVLPGEADRGELYPVWNAGLETFAQFGIGIGLYNFQLIILFAIFFLLSFILAPVVFEYYNSDRGIASDNRLLKVSSSCIITNATATIGCPDGDPSCIIRSRENCSISFQSILLDLAMSLFFCLAILFARFAENKIIEDLDEAIQTASDYSVVVLDPTEDADNPDEWFEFFSRFGKVRYITIFRENEEVTRAIIRLHMVELKIAEYTKLHNDAVSDQFEKLLQLRTRLKMKLDLKCRTHYPVCRVYCTFEKEEHQRLCLQELEVPDINAILDIKDFSSTRLLFRNENVLNVKEPCEPDNILWSNLSTNKYTRAVSSFLSLVFSVGLLVAVWFITKAVGNSAPNALGIVIGIIDSVLPAFFEVLTNMNYPKDEGRRQGMLQLRLFGARLLITTVLPYFQSPWDQALSVEFISQIINVQIFACFFSPIISFLDISGVIQRNIIGFRRAETQTELHRYWRGSNWSLADKYTAIAKIVFVSLYYSLLTPIALVFATIAFGLTFFIDRYLLLRRYKPLPMINEKIAVQMRQEILLAIAAHMYITCRYVYSWPMDQVYLHQDGVIERVNKYPMFQIWLLGQRPWQTEEQQLGLLIYQIGTLCVWAVTVYIWLLAPVWNWFLGMFCKRLNTVGETQGISFSELDQVVIYEPTIYCMDKPYRCVHTIDVLPHHRPHVESSQIDKGDLASYIPDIHRADVLTIIKYYGNEAVAEAGDSTALSQSAQPAENKYQLARTYDSEVSFLERSPAAPTRASLDLNRVDESKSNSEFRSARIMSSRLRDSGLPDLTAAESSARAKAQQFRYVTMEDGTLKKMSSSVPIVGEAILDRIRPRPVGDDNRNKEMELVPPAVPPEARKDARKYLTRDNSRSDPSGDDGNFHLRRSRILSASRDRILPMPELSDSPPKENYLRK